MRIVKSIQILYVLFLAIGGISCSGESPEGELNGFYREEKGDSEYERDKKENLYLFYKKDGMIFGKVLGLDVPLENGRLRSCGYCDSPAPALPGYDIIQNLKLESGYYKGKFYDVYNRKWFDLKIHFVDSGSINLRIYAYIPIFGKNIRWKVGEGMFRTMIGEKTEGEPVKHGKNLYALVLGEKNKNQISYYPGIAPESFRGAIGFWYDKFGNTMEGNGLIVENQEAFGDYLLVFYKKK